MRNLTNNIDNVLNPWDVLITIPAVWQGNISCSHYPRLLLFPPPSFVEHHLWIPGERQNIHPIRSNNAPPLFPNPDLFSSGSLDTEVFSVRDERKETYTDVTWKTAENISFQDSLCHSVTRGPVSQIIFWECVSGIHSRGTYILHSVTSTENTPYWPQFLQSSLFQWII